MDFDIVEQQLATRYVGRVLTFRETVDSTSKLARKAVGTDATDGAVFIAEKQTAGRGRFDRSWQSPPGGLWFSILLKSGTAPSILPLLPMAASLALKDSLQKTLSLAADIAWPNDLMHNGKKLAGLLLEPAFSGNKLDFAVLGVGLNANNSRENMPPDVQAIATTCASIIGKPVRREPVLAAFLNEFELLYEELKQGNQNAIFERWKKALALEGELISIRRNNEITKGTVKKVSSNGAITLHTKEGTIVTVSMDHGSLHTSKYSKKI